MQGLPSILSFFFCNKFNKLNNSKAGILDSLSSYDIKITSKSHI